MPRQLNVLGCQAAYPTHGNPCSGFLLNWDGVDIVLDLGYGTLEQLLSHRPNGRVDAIVITHDHPDHWLDLHGLFRLLHYGADPDQQFNKTALYCPASVVSQMTNLEPDVSIHGVFDVHTLYDRCSYTVGPFTLSGLLLPHYVPNIGVRLEAVSQGSAPFVLAYTGDTGPTPLLAELGKNADLFIVEATDRVGELAKKAQDRKLMTSSEAGFWAAKSNARRLLLTHFWPGNDSREAMLRAKQSYGGDVLAAKPGYVVEL